MKTDVKVKLVLEDGYEKRFTDCCLAILRRSREARELERKRPEAALKKAEKTATA